MSNPGAIWKRVQRPLAMSVLCGAMLASLSGCVALVAGGAISGTLAASDRRTFGAQTEDRAIEVKGGIKINNVTGDAGHVNINSFNRRALITGEVRDDAMKAAVEREVRSIEGVIDVINELDVAGLASYTSRSSDTIINRQGQGQPGRRQGHLRQFLSGGDRARRGLPAGPRDPARRPDRRRHRPWRQRRDQGGQGV